AELYETNDISSAQRITLAYKYIPEAISRRLSSISIESSSASARFAFYRDALKIIKDHPILGTGGGGWEATYKAYQSYEYFTTEVHNFFLQLWVETGTVGLIALAALCIIALFMVHRTLVSDIEITAKALTWGTLSGAVALLGHSGMDFNLSLGAVALYLWQLFGVIKFSGISSSQKDQQKEIKTAVSALPLAGISCVLIILSFLLYQGYSHGQQGVRSIEQQDIAKAREHFAKAAKFDPYTASYKADLAQIDYFIASQTEDEDLLQKSEAMRVEAVRLDPYNARLKTQLAAYYLEQGKLDEGIFYLEETTKVNPFNIENWENLVDAYYKTAVICIRQEQRDKALELLNKSQKTFDEISQHNSKAPKTAGDKLEVTNELMLYVYKSKLLAENIHDDKYYRKLDRLIFASDFTVDADNDGVPDLWRISNSKDGLLEVYIGEAAKITNKGEGPSYLVTRQDFSLNPQTSYTINFFVGGDMPGEKIQFYVFSREGENTQHHWKDVQLSSQISNISTSFVTTEDLVEGKQWLRIDIQGASEEPLNVKSIEIWEE
ncbi:MAG: O-antigen ligase family protein, partial [Tepidanaerobacteraceae bacterium]